MLEFSIITISSFVTLLDSITRYIGKFCFKKDISRVIPIFSIIYGVALGVCGFYTPNVEMGTNLIEAVFIGLSAGAAATGINQVGKQLNKKDEEAEKEDMVNTAMSILGEFLEGIKTEGNKNDVEEEIPISDEPEVEEEKEPEVEEELCEEAPPNGEEEEKETDDDYAESE